MSRSPPAALRSVPVVPAATVTARSSVIDSPFVRPNERPPPASVIAPSSAPSQAGSAAARNPLLTTVPPV